MAAGGARAPGADDTDKHMTMDQRAFLRDLFDTAVARARPDHTLAAFLPAPPSGRTVVLGAGKAAAAMAAAVDAAWPADAPLSGLVVTRYGHALSRAGRIEVVEAAHPVPDAAGVQASQRMLALADSLGADDLALCLISGGGSALLSLPAPGLTLADKQAINQALLRSGANIAEMNCVRKHLSAIKGGRLALRCAPARVLSLLISDVPGDDVATIASGPTVADPTTCAQALAILEHYRIALPQGVREGLLSARYETPKPGDARLAGHAAHLIATPRQSLEAAAALARAAGIHALVLGDDIEGESAQVGAEHARLARAVAAGAGPVQRPCVLLSGGETTVTLGQSQGRGGRASEYLLACALGLEGAAGVWGLAADTDGIDGVEDNAGAHSAPDTLARALSLGIDAAQHLAAHNAYPFFAALDDLVVTGPTGTNVNDFRALLVL